jgi:hypothetical protein
MPGCLRPSKTSSGGQQNLRQAATECGGLPSHHPSVLGADRRFGTTVPGNAPNYLTNTYRPIMCPLAEHQDASAAGLTRSLDLMRTRELAAPEETSDGTGASGPSGPSFNRERQPGRRQNH